MTPHAQPADATAQPDEAVREAVTDWLANTTVIRAGQVIGRHQSRISRHLSEILEGDRDPLATYDAAQLLAILRDSPATLAAVIGACARGTGVRGDIYGAVQASLQAASCASAALDPSSDGGSAVTAAESRQIIHQLRETIATLSAAVEALRNGEGVQR